MSGDSVRAGLVAEEAYHRFAGHPDPATAAVICQRAARFRAIDAPDTGLPLIKQALQLFEQAPPSAEHAEAWLAYAGSFLRARGGWKTRPRAAPGTGNRRSSRCHRADPPHPGQPRARGAPGRAD